MYFVYQNFDCEGVSTYSHHRTEEGALRKILELVSEFNDSEDIPSHWEIQKTYNKTTYYSNPVSIVMEKITLQE